jgi:8-oxo-dGTP diphosphatase
MAERMRDHVIRAAGGVLWRPIAGGAEGGVEVAVIHRPRYDDWSLPKGKLASGELELEAAMREVLEETGHRVTVGRPLGESRYLKESPDGPREKRVRWWAMRADGGSFSPGREVDELRWVSLSDAQAMLTRDTDRDVLDRFARGPAPTRSVLLVRHASAGSRTTWDRDDRERPLDDDGWTQADELVRLLSRFDVAEIVSADYLRCVQTVEPLAMALELPIREEPLLSESVYPGREDEAVALVRSAGAPLRDAVACSQGDVIPDLLERLIDEDGLEVEPFEPAKGGVWELTLHGDRLVGADYLPPPAVASARR